MSSPKRRIETDSSRMMSDYEVTLVNDNSMIHPAPILFINDTDCLIVSVTNRLLLLAKRPTLLTRCAGKSSLYDSRARKRGGLWKIHVELPDQYPYKSPSIGFVNRIFHPNIDELSGSVCLDVINQTWSPMYEMVNIFEVFLPQLLRYPNPTDPLNGEAAALMMREPKSYEAKVKEYVSKYASREAAEDAGEDSDDDDEMSSVGSFDSGDDDEPAGNMDEI
ncbi:hypothetical protein E4T47_02053 [Aureobasidium subglaciale]|nr:hypothetical protein E4T47_02053 [Aureobasidium subglaciale]